MEQQAKCEAIKEDGKQCTRNQPKDNTLCTQHQKQDKKKATTINDIEPWTLLKLPVPFEANGKSINQKIRTRLKRGPRKNDGAGWIYIYCLQHEQNQKLNYYKIGRTNRRVTHRMKEWDDIHKDQGKVKLIDSHHVEHGIDFCERLIHKYLAYCNMHRYPHNKGFHSVWALDPNEVIDDGQQRKEGEERPIAKNKHVEWFCEDITDIRAVVEPIVKKKDWNA
jgi:hypothetical protein